MLVNCKQVIALSKECCSVIIGWSIGPQAYNASSATGLYLQPSVYLQLEIVSCYTSRLVLFYSPCWPQTWDSSHFSLPSCRDCSPVPLSLYRKTFILNWSQFFFLWSDCVYFARKLANKYLYSYNLRCGETMRKDRYILSHFSCFYNMALLDLVW